MYLLFRCASVYGEESNGKWGIERQVKYSIELQMRKCACVEWRVSIIRLPFGADRANEPRHLPHAPAVLNAQMHTRRTSMMQ